MKSVTRLPALFIGHGSPMNAIEDNEFSLAWGEIARQMPKPRLILCISAHWETRGSWLTAMDPPRIIYDFYGFPRELYSVSYPAPGSRELVNLVKDTVKQVTFLDDHEWGLDHGSWSVLCRMYPGAEIPVVQLSLNRDQPATFHYALGQALRPLRDEGVLILGSGNMVHNLRLAAWEDGGYDWAVAYDARLKEWIEQGDHEQVVHFERHGEAAQLSVNSAEHYLPLLYVLGAGYKDEPVSFINETVTMGSISMRCVRLG